MIKLDVILCRDLYTSGCYDNVTEIMEAYENDALQLYTSEGYFDQTDQSDPIKFRLNKNERMPVSFQVASLKTINIKQNQVKDIQDQT